MTVLPVSMTSIDESRKLLMVGETIAVLYIRRARITAVFNLDPELSLA